VKYLAWILFIVLLAPAALAGETIVASEEAGHITDATAVVREFAGMSEGPPRSLVEKAVAVVVIPGLKKAGFVIGGKHGSGVLSEKAADGTWGAPVFVKITGGSIGWQIGVSSTDLVLLFMREKNVSGILDGKFTLGGDATVAAGPVGRSGSAGTDVKLDAEIYSYSRSRGAFAGIAIDGSKLYPDKSANVVYYGADADTHAIIKEKAKPGSAGEDLVAALAAFSRGETK
jgi:lipid-binding SYLF domain-containing protein